MKRRYWTADEDRQLRQLAGTKTAEEIGMILGRTKLSVHSRVNKLGIDGKLYGENHWNAKIESLKVSMVHALYDAGFTVNEISKVLDMKLMTVNDIAAGRTRKNG